MTQYVIESYTSVGINGTVGPFTGREETVAAVHRMQDEGDPFSGLQVAIVYGLDEWLAQSVTDDACPEYKAFTADDLVIDEDVLWVGEINDELRAVAHH